MNQRLILALAAFFLIAGNTWSQTHFSQTFNRSIIYSQIHQPANINYVDEDIDWVIGISGGLNVANNGFTLKGVFGEDGYIPRDVRERMLDEMNDAPLIDFGWHRDYLNLNARIKGRMFGFTLREFVSTSVELNNPQTLGLILLGNKQYAGQTITDEGISIAYSQFRELGVSTGFEKDKWKFGVRLKFLQGVQNMDTQDLHYSLFTHEDGDTIEVTAGYDFRRTEMIGGTGLFDFQGFGGGIDIGAVWEASDKLNLSLAVNNLGIVSWNKGKMYNSSVNVVYEGFEVNSLFGNDVNDAGELSSDTLINLIVPDSSYGSYSTMLPAQVQAGADYKLGEKNHLSMNILYGLSRTSMVHKLPLVNLGFRREFSEKFMAGANYYGLGTDMYGFGVFGSYTFEFSGGAKKLNLLAGSNNILGFALPSVGKGFNLYGGITFSM